MDILPAQFMTEKNYIALAPLVEGAIFYLFISYQMLNAEDCYKTTPANSFLTYCLNVSLVVHENDLI